MARWPPRPIGGRDSLSVCRVEPLGAPGVTAAGDFAPVADTRIRQKSGPARDRARSGRASGAGCARRDAQRLTPHARSLGGGEGTCPAGRGRTVRDGAPRGCARWPAVSWESPCSGRRPSRGAMTRAPARVDAGTDIPHPRSPRDTTRRAKLIHYQVQDGRGRGRPTGSPPGILSRGSKKAGAAAPARSGKKRDADQNGIGPSSLSVGAETGAVSASPAMSGLGCGRSPCRGTGRARPGPAGSRSRSGRSPPPLFQHRVWNLPTTWTSRTVTACLTGMSISLSWKVTMRRHSVWSVRSPVLASMYDSSVAMLRLATRLYGGSPTGWS